MDSNQNQDIPAIVPS